VLPVAADEVGPVTAAAIGAIGAVLGGGMTAGATVLVEGRRQHHAANDQRERDDRARTAAEV
jgi:hypothetical protein